MDSVYPYAQDAAMDQLGQPRPVPSTAPEDFRFPRGGAAVASFPRPAAAVSDDSISDRAAPAVFSISDFHLYFGRTHVLKSVSLAIGRTGVHAVIGPSGCGKSSFLRSLNRMNDRILGHRVEGAALMDGQDIYARGVDVVALRRRIGMVFQRPITFPMSIYDNVAYGPRLHRLARTRAELDQVVEQSLSMGGLWDEVKDRLRQPATALSGGQQQRLAIARALAVKPEVILLDEPTSAIDPAGTARIEDTLSRLGESYAIVLVTHNIGQAARVSHRTALFLEGELVEEGPTQQIFVQPRDPRTEDYVTGRFPGRAGR